MKREYYEQQAKEIICDEYRKRIYEELSGINNAKLMQNLYKMVVDLKNYYSTNERNK